MSLILAVIMCFMGTVNCFIGGGESPVEPPRAVTLRYSSFSGGGYEYSAEIGDPEILSFRSYRDYGDTEGEIPPGAGFDEVFIFEGVKPGMTLMSGEKAEATPGNCLPLGLIPLGLFVHCVELIPGQGAKVARSAGTEAQIMAREGDTVTLKMASGEVRLFSARCKATVGAVGNKDWGSIHLGKAGRKRYLGVRPTVRGVAMNPVDHPMGGGEGRTSGGSHPRSPWGQLAKGGKTRNPHKASNKVIVKRRK